MAGQGDKTKDAGEAGLEGPPASASRIARNATVQAAAFLTSTLGALVFYVVMARILGRQGFGDFNFALSICLLIGISGLGTEYRITEEIARSPERVHSLFWNAVGIRLVIGGVGLLAAIVATAAAGEGAQVLAAVAILGVSTWIDVLARTVHAVLRGLEDMGPIAAGWIVQRVVTAVGGSIALLSGGGLIGAALLYLAGAVVGLAYVSAKLVMRNVKPRRTLSWTRVRELITASIPLALGNLFIVILARVDVVILSLLKGNAAVGTYSAAYRLFEGTVFIAAMLGLSSYPALSRLSRDSTPTIADAYEKGCKVLIAILMPLGAVFCLFGDSLISLLYGEGYGASVVPMQILGISVPLWGICVFSIFVLAAQGRQRWVGVSLALGLLLNVALNFALIPKFSYGGAAAAMTISVIFTDLLLVTGTVRCTGQIRGRRVLLAPTLSTAAMAVMVLATGTGLIAIPVVLLLYLGAVWALERTLFPEDLAFMRRTFRRGVGLRPSSGSSVSAAGGSDPS